MRYGVALGLAALLALRAAAPVRAQEDSPYGDDQGPDEQGGYDQAAGDSGQEGQAPAPEDYGDALNPYGSWVEDPTYGRVWHPAVGSDWRPYVDGYWAWTSSGWTWVSYEPWGWTFHYGRWALLPVGWVWVPGFVWGPAWVTWFWGDGFVGWAPLAPFGTTIVINNFVFVHEHFFCHPHVAMVIVDHHHLPGRIVHDWGRQHFHAPAFDRIQRVAYHPVKRFEHRPAETLAPWRRHAAGRLQRPGVVPRPGRERGHRAFAPKPRQERGRRGFAPEPRHFDRPRRRHDETPHLQRPEVPRAHPPAPPGRSHLMRPPRPSQEPFSQPARPPRSHLARPQSWSPPRWSPPAGLRRWEVHRETAPARVQARQYRPRGFAGPAAGGFGRPAPQSHAGHVAQGGDGQRPAVSRGLGFR